MSTLSVSPISVAPESEFVRVQADKSWGAARLIELWQYRELIGFLTLRDLKVRYKQTILGAAWAIVQPLMAMVVFTVFLGKLGKLDQDSKVPYAVLTFAALLPWQLFSGALTQASTSLVANERLVTKVYFPRLIIPISAVLARLADFGISLLVLFVMMPMYHMGFRWEMLALPLYIVATLVISIAGGLWLSAANVKYRDVGYLVPFIVQLLMWVSPVAYPSSIVKGHWRFWYFLNPVSDVIDGFRWALLGEPAPPAASMAIAFGLTVLVLIGGMIYFRRAEEGFADVI